MKGVELYGRVRYAVRIEGLSERAAARRFGLDPRTVNKMMKFAVPPGYVPKKPPAKPKLDPFIAVIRCTCDDNVDGKTISKWARALRYVAHCKPHEMPVKTFIKELGGVNACADLYARYFWRAL
jgi:hypothetical protein